MTWMTILRVMFMPLCVLTMILVTGANTVLEFGRRISNSTPRPLELGAVDMDLSTTLKAPTWFGKLKELKSWTLDSGASQSVSHPADLPHAELSPSPGSLAGQVYLGPGGEEIKNDGQLKASSMLETGNLAKVKFQAARVRNPLLAVSDVVDKDNMVVFDKQSFVIPARAPEAAEIRRLIQQVKNRIPVHREKGVYRIRNWVPAEAVFARRCR